MYPIPLRATLIQHIQWNFSSMNYVLMKWGSNGLNMMTSWNDNISRFTVSIWGESTDHLYIPLTKANDTELWGFL